MNEKKINCNDCFITGSRKNSDKSLKDALSKIKKFESQGFVPAGRDDVPPVPINLPFEWSYGPEKDPNWKMQCHAWRMLDPYFVAYELTGKHKYLDTIIEYVSDWWHWYEFRADRLGRAWYDMSVGLRSCKIALLYQWLHGNNRYRKQLRVVQSLVLSHAEKLLDENNINDGNHGIFQSHGLMCLAKSGSMSSALAEVAATLSDKYLRHIFYSQFDEEGVHQEGSFEYQRFAIDKFRTTINSPLWSLELKSEISEMLALAESNHYWMVYPDGHEVPVGDSDGKFVGRLSNEDLESSVWKCSLGYNVFKKCASARCDESYFLFISKTKDGVHGHDDFNSFMLWERGNDILIDPGKYAYVKDYLRKYFLSSAAHNSARISELDYDIGNITIERTWFDELALGVGGGLVFSIGDCRREVKQHRYFRYYVGKFLYVVDYFEANQEEELVISFQFDKMSEPVLLLDDQETNSEKQGINVRVNVIAPLVDVSVAKHYFDPDIPAGISSLGGGYKSVMPCYSVVISGSGSGGGIESTIFLDDSLDLEALTLLEEAKDALRLDRLE